MIIKCQKCSTKFRLDDSRVTEAGVKVRCTKCKHVFMVQKEGANEEPGDSERVLADTLSFAGSGAEAAEEFDGKGLAVEATPSSPFDTGTSETTALRGTPVTDNPFDISSFDSFTVSSGSDDISGANKPALVVEPSAAASDFDFSSFDFSENVSEPESEKSAAVPAPAVSPPDIPEVAAPQQQEVAGGFDFSDELFGTPDQPVPEVAGKAISFNFEEDSFAQSHGSLGLSGAGGSLFALDAVSELSAKQGDSSPGKETETADTTPTVPDVLPIKSTPEVIFDAPVGKLTPPELNTAAPPVLPDHSVDDDQSQELPPLLIGSRRKKSPVSGVLIAAVVLVVVGVLGYFGFTTFSEQKNAAVAEAGKISVRAIKASFVMNAKAGELLVITGEILNEYPKARAALQVKADVLDGAGQSVAAKSAYGGNSLTKEQLETLPLDKIEAAMANQFGDSLVNMEVAAGKAIPFVVVLASLPKNAKDFTVQPAGSTVATAK